MQKDEIFSFPMIRVWGLQTECSNKICISAKRLRLCFLLILRYKIQFTPVPEYGILKQFLRGSYTNWVLISTLHTHTQ
jgi:hypothetical protein